MIPQLDRHPIPAERLHEATQLPASGTRSVAFERGGHGSLPAPGQRPPVPASGVGQVAEREPRRTLLAGEMPEAQRTGQPGVPLGTVGEEHEVLAMRIRLTELRAEPPLAPAGGGRAVGLALGRLFLPDHPLDVPTSPEERDLGAEHGRQPDRPGRLGEADDAVQPVVVGERERFETEPGCLFGELLRMRGTVEEGEVRVAVQLGIGRGRPPAALGNRRLERLALAAPRRAVATGVPARATRGAPIGEALPREASLELAPRHGRIVEAHGRQPRRTCVRSTLDDHPATFSRGRVPGRRPAQLL